MNLDYLHEFVVLAHTGNYQEAAGLLYISQSALSKHIKHMEEQLAVPLFLRTTRKVELSEYGRLLLPYANRMLELQTEYSAALLNNTEEERKKLDLGSIPALAQYGITDVLARFRREHPGFRFRITQQTSDELKDMLRSGEIELAFVRETGRPTDEFVHLRYAADRMVAVLPENHPLAGQASVPLSQLAGEEFILLPDDTMLYHLCVDACKENGFTPHVAYTDHRIENIIALTRQGMGIALLMDKIAHHAPVSGTVVVEVTPHYRTRLDVCHRKDKPLSMAARHFLQCLERY